MNKKQEYYEYLLMLSEDDLKIEAATFTNYVDNLVEVYNDLINILEENIILNTQSKLFNNTDFKIKEYFNDELTKLLYYLDIETSSFLQKSINDFKNEDKHYNNYKKTELIDDIMFNYSLIFEVNETQCPIPDSNSIRNFKILNYSWYDALRKLYESLINKVQKYIKRINTTNELDSYITVQGIIDEIIDLTQEYCDHNIDLSRSYKNLLSEENYEILVKYNCFNSIIKTIKSKKYKNFDFTDFKFFFKNTKIVKIINSYEEILLLKDKPNKLLIIGFNDIENIEEIKVIIKKFQKECDNNDCEYLFGKSKNLLVVYLLENNI
jgi:hypothetical protein